MIDPDFPDPWKLQRISPAGYHRLARKLRNEVAESSLTDVALLSSNSFSAWAPFLTVEAHRLEAPMRFRIAEYGQLEQSIVSGAGILEPTAPDVVVIAVRPEDLNSDIYTPISDNGSDEILGRLTEIVERIVSIVRALRQRTDSAILVANFQRPAEDFTARLFDNHDGAGLQAAISSANETLRRVLSRESGVHVWDYAGLVNAVGALRWTDERLWFMSRQTVSTENLPLAANHLARCIRALVVPRVKCLVLDLDNTLWGGVLSEDGVEGILISDDYPGNEFKAFQRTIAALRKTGVLLAIASKNEPAIVQRAFLEHPDMILGWSDFSARQIGWHPKSESMQLISDELNIGMNSIVFFDDNPVERQEVRMNTPEVRVIEVPDNPMDFRSALFASGLFDTAVFTEEDRLKARMYEHESQRHRLRETVQTMEEFLASLEMKLKIETLTDASLARAAQIVAKTNQFNASTQRYSAAELASMMADQNTEIRTYRVTDKFGDSGIVGLTIIQFNGAVGLLDSFIMSCRVMNRQLEYAMLADVLSVLESKSCSTLLARYLPTKKNSPVKRFFEDAGFALSDNGKQDGHYSMESIHDRPVREMPTIFQLVAAC